MDREVFLSASLVKVIGETGNQYLMLRSVAVNGCRIQDAGYEILDTRFWIRDAGCDTKSGSVVVV